MDQRRKIERFMKAPSSISDFADMSSGLKDFSVPTHLEQPMWDKARQEYLRALVEKGHIM